MTAQTLAFLFRQHFSETNTCYEATPRKCAGSFGWVRHRFPIKNGITFQAVILTNIQASNKLFIRIKEGKLRDR